MKARDVRTMIKEHSFEPAVVTILETMIEVMNDNQKQITELVAISAGLVDQVSQITVINDQLHTRLKAAQKRERMEGVSVHSELADDDNGG